MMPSGGPGEQPPMSRSQAPPQRSTFGTGDIAANLGLTAQQQQHLLQQQQQQMAVLNASLQSMTPQQQLMQLQQQHFSRQGESCSPNQVHQLPQQQTNTRFRVPMPSTQMAAQQRMSQTAAAAVVAGHRGFPMMVPGQPQQHGAVHSQQMQSKIPGMTALTQQLFMNNPAAAAAAAMYGFGTSLGPTGNVLTTAQQQQVQQQRHRIFQQQQQQVQQQRQRFFQQQQQQQNQQLETSRAVAPSVGNGQPRPPFRRPQMPQQQPSNENSSPQQSGGLMGNVVKSGTPKRPSITSNEGSLNFGRAPPSTALNTPFTTSSPSDAPIRAWGTGPGMPTSAREGTDVLPVASPADEGQNSTRQNTVPLGVLLPGALLPGAFPPGILSPGDLSPDAFSPGRLSSSGDGLSSASHNQFVMAAANLQRKEQDGPKDYTYTECILRGLLLEERCSVERLVTTLSGLVGSKPQLGLWKTEAYRSIIDAEETGINLLKSGQVISKELWLRQYIKPECLQNFYLLRTYSPEHIVVTEYAPCNARRVCEVAASPQITRLLPVLGYKKRGTNDAFVASYLFHSNVGSAENHFLISIQKHFKDEFMRDELFPGRLIVEITGRVENDTQVEALGRKLLNFSQMLVP